MDIEDIEDIIMSIITLGIATLTDYYHTTGEAYISSAIPIFICQMVMMMNEMYKKKNNGKGIVRSVIEKIKGNQGN